MKRALNWWYNVLTDHGRSRFPKPKSNDDILDYYNDIPGNIIMEYGMHNF